jgi:hypothetical protein
MAQFLALLTLYYACDSVAGKRPMTSSEVLLCMEHYSAVKSHFDVAPNSAGADSSERAGSNRAAYLAFKTWEVEHADLVQSLRDSLTH